MVILTRIMIRLHKDHTKCDEFQELSLFPDFTDRDAENGLGEVQPLLIVLGTSVSSFRNDVC